MGEPIGPSGVFKGGKAVDLVLLEQLARLLRVQARDGEESQRRDGRLLAKSLKRPVLSGQVQSLDLFADRSADPGDFSKPPLADHDCQRLCQGHKGLGGPKICAGLERAIAAQLDPLSELAQQPGDFSRIQFVLLCDRRRGSGPLDGSAQVG